VNDDPFVRLICETACPFYKPGKEDLECGGYRYLSRRYSPEELRRMIGTIALPPLPKAPYTVCEDLSIEELVCSSCPFRADGCDFAEDRSGPPCGGYLILFNKKLAHSE
jgi:hypothetical protein